MIRSLLHIVLPLVVLCAVIASFGFRRVTRHRLARFALRQRLTLTPGNVSVVARYLATTRRWRVGGMAISAATALDWAWATDQQFGAPLIPAFVGWFVGAIVAEWRIATPASAAARSASLIRRRVTEYVPRHWLAAATLIWVGAALVELLSLRADRASDADVTARLLGLFGLQLAATILLAAVTHRVLTRPQPVDEASVVEADDALRSRSLQVLTGSAIAIGGFLGALAGVAVLTPDSPPANLVKLVGAVLIAIVGVAVACGPYRSTRPAAVGASLV